MKKIITPALVLEYDLLLSNIKKMAEFGRKNYIGIRPHFKTHKCVEIAKLQLKAGAVGVTVQTIDEAEALVEGGVGKVLLANELVGKEKVIRFLKLVKKDNELILTVDSEDNLKLADTLSGIAGKNLNVLVEVDVGMNRCGRKPGKESLEFVRKVLRCRHIVFKGLQGYEGHTVLIPGRKDRTAASGASLKALVDTKVLLLENGIDCEIVTAGGTGTYDLTGFNANITDIQPGSYVYMDAKYGKVTGDFKKSLYVLSTILCRRDNGDYIGDAGHKALTSEFGMPELRELKGEMLRLNEEHCRFKISAEGGSAFGGENKKNRKIKQVKITPSHCCTTVNLYDNIYVVRKDKVIGVWKVNRKRKT